MNCVHSSSIQNPKIKNHPSVNPKNQVLEHVNSYAGAFIYLVVWKVVKLLVFYKLVMRCIGC